MRDNRRRVKRKGKEYLIIRSAGHTRAGYYRNGVYIDPVYVASTTYLKKLSN